MSKYINIVIIFQSNFHKGLETNILQAGTLCTYIAIEMGLPGYKGKGQGQTKVKNKIFHNSNLSSTNSVTMFVFRKDTNVYGSKTFIFCTLYNLYKFKMAANMLKTTYYNLNVHT